MTQDWIYIADKQPPEDEDLWVTCITKNGTSVCLAYLEDDVWRFSNDMIAHWKDEELLDMGWEPYAYQPYVIPTAAPYRTIK